MNIDRFCFRVYDKNNKQYIDSDETETFINNDASLLFGSFGEVVLPPEEQSNYIIEQCTGLKDKNGNLIYEGDILLLRNNNFEVENNGITVFFKCLTDECIHIDPLDFDYNNSEIIGNIHEQKERL